MDKPETIVKIENSSKEYLLGKKEIDSDNKVKFYIREIVKKNLIGYDSKGIYRLYTSRSPSFTYIILKDEENFQIMDLRNFSETLKSISDFLSSGFEDNVVVDYLDAILKIYKYNGYDEKIRM